MEKISELYVILEDVPGTVSELLRLLKKQGASVKVIMTPNALAFVGSLTFEALSGQSVCSSLFQENNDEASQQSADQGTSGENAESPGGEPERDG